MVQVKFQNTEDARKGYSVLLHSGTVVYTRERDSYIVPEESVDKLDAAKIRFEVKPISPNGNHKK